MKTPRLSLTRRVLAMKFATEFVLIYGLYTIMFQDRGGMSAAQIGVILATGFILSLVFEIPTGIIADKIPRKYVINAAIAAKTLALFGWLLLPTFWGFMLAAALFALSDALESGALQAYLYGTLGDDNKKAFNRVWARVSSMVMVSYTSAYVLATVIGVKYELLTVLSIVSCLVALAIAATLPKDNLALEPDVKPKIFASALSYMRQNTSLLRLLAKSVIVVSMAQLIIEYILMYYNQVGVPTRYVPLVMAVGNIIGAVAFWTLHSWEGKLNKYKISLTVGFTAMFILSFQMGAPLVTVGFLLYSRFFRVLQVQFESNIQHLADDKTRATITSIASFASKTIAAIASVVIGLTAIQDQIVAPLRTTLIAGATVFTVILVVEKYIMKKPYTGTIEL